MKLSRKFDRGCAEIFSPCQKCHENDAIAISVTSMIVYDALASGSDCVDITGETAEKRASKTGFPERVFHS